MTTTDRISLAQTNDVSARLTAKVGNMSISSESHVHVLNEADAYRILHGLSDLLEMINIMLEDRRLTLTLEDIAPETPSQSRLPPEMLDELF